jgi:hypothetical protein
MAAANRGAKRVEGSLTIGILPCASGGVAPDVDVAVFTGMGNARDAINVLSSSTQTYLKFRDVELSAFSGQGSACA